MKSSADGEKKEKGERESVEGGGEKESSRKKKSREEIKDGESMKVWS